MNPFVIQKKSKYSFSEIGRVVLFLLTKTDQSIKMSRYKRYFLYVFVVSYACWVITGAITPIIILYYSLDISIIIFEIALNIIAIVNMSVIGFLKSRYI